MHIVNYLWKFKYLMQFKPYALKLIQIIHVINDTVNVIHEERWNIY